MQHVLKQWQDGAYFSVVGHSLILNQGQFGSFTAPLLGVQAQHALDAVFTRPRLERHLWQIFIDDRKKTLRRSSGHPPRLSSRDDKSSFRGAAPHQAAEERPYNNQTLATAQ
ncbi:MAG: hypothetical protein P1U82_19705 [Verrucomicrobiales bacterium]|nr:hypothetical protein [Verrucomicrobiales bacterium]MDF1788097.1 hypothetical protein [Verrucomicrobiales bacterium]